MADYRRKIRNSLAHGAVYAAFACSLGACADQMPVSDFMAVGPRAQAPAGLDILAAPTRRRLSTVSDRQRRGASALSERKAYDWSLVFTAGAEGKQHLPSLPRSAENAQTPRPAVPLTPRIWALLSNVNRQVNSHVPLDEIGSGGALNPAGPARMPSCQDYVAAKLHSLRAAGIPEDALSIAVAQTSWGKSHAVLIVATNRGEFVLDNLSPWVTPWAALDYRWLKRQAPGRTGRWVWLTSVDKDEDRAG